MKIAFVGKGGSGKTTLSSLFSRYIAAEGLPVFAIDADINQHMAESLGMSESQAKSLPPLGLEMSRVKEYLRGSNPLIRSNEEMIKTTPPGKGSNILSFNERNPIYSYFQKEVNGVRVMVTGPFDESDLGVKCYHSKVGATEMILNHMVDKEREYVVVDMTAGADSFASGLFTRFDMTFVVVEPTLKSLGVYEQYKQYASNYAVALKAIGNKIESEDDIEFLKDKIGDDLLACFGRSQYIRNMEKGHHAAIEQLEPENKNVLQTMLNSVNVCLKDWNKYYQQMIEFHIKNGKSWANAQLGINVEKQIDKNFSFEL